MRNMKNTIMSLIKLKQACIILFNFVLEWIRRKKKLNEKVLVFIFL